MDTRNSNTVQKKGKLQSWCKCLEAVGLTIRKYKTNWLERVEHNDSLRCTQLDRTASVVFS